MGRRDGSEVSDLWDRKTDSYRNYEASQKSRALQQEEAIVPG